MNPLQISYFITVADCGNFTQAAENIHVSQPAVSKQISALEEELGAKLIMRSGKKATLTPAGKKYYDFFIRSTTEFYQLKNSVTQDGNFIPSAKMKISVIFFIDWDISIFMTPVIQKISKQYPNLEIEMENRGIYEIAQTIMSPKYDITVCFDHIVPEHMLPYVSKRYLADVHRMLYCSRQNPITQKKDVKFADFRDMPCVALYNSKHPEPGRTIRIICDKYGFEPKFTFKPNHDSVTMTVQSGYGYCIYDEWSRQRTNNSLFSMPLDYTRRVYVYWKKENLNPAIPIIVNGLSEMLSEGNTGGAVINTPEEDEEF